MVFEDEDAFLLPVASRGHWLFSYTCTEWDVDPDALTGGVSAANLGAARERVLGDRHWAYFPEKRFPFFRVRPASNFSPSAAPAGHPPLSLAGARRRGRSSARAAFSRKRAAKSAELPSSAVSRSSILSGSTISWTTPIAFASSAGSSRAVKIISLARDGPIRSTSRE